MLKVLKQIIGYLLIKMHRFEKKDQNDILSLFFHNPPKKLFDKILKWLIKHNYKVISLQELEISITQKKRINKSAIITFDDGWKENLELLNLIEKYQMPVAIFIPTESVISGNYWFEYARIKGQQNISGIRKIQDFKNLPSTVLSEKVNLLKNFFTLKRSCLTLDELKMLSKNKFVTLGSHTVSHPILSKCSYEMQEYELSQSKIILNEWLNINTSYLAYPNGDYDNNTLRIVKQCNYKLCFTIHSEKINVEEVNPYQIPRYCIDDNGGYFESIAKALGIWQKCFYKKK